MYQNQESNNQPVPFSGEEDDFDLQKERGSNGHAGGLFVKENGLQGKWQEKIRLGEIFYPIGPMYIILTYIYHKNRSNVGKYTIHGSYGYRFLQIW